MPQNIHPTAVIDASVALPQNITIDAFAVVYKNVSLGEGCQLGAHSVLLPFVTLGCGNIVTQHAVLGGLAQDTKFKQNTVSHLCIGDNNTFREGVTAHRSASENGKTQIGNNCFFMAGSHIAHDCTVGDNTIFANNCAIGGHVAVGDNVFIGGGAMVHQFCRVGSYAIVQGLAGLNKDALPFVMVAGRPAKHYRLNSVGLRRANISGERLQTIGAAFRLLKNGEDLGDLPTTQDLRYLQQWLAVKSSRGILGFAAAKSKM